MENDKSIERERVTVPAFKAIRAHPLQTKRQMKNDEEMEDKEQKKMNLNVRSKVFTSLLEEASTPVDTTVS